MKTNIFLIQIFRSFGYNAPHFSLKNLRIPVAETFFQSYSFYIELNLKIP